MASGDDIEAGRTTTGYSTTFLIAEIPELGSRTGFNGDAVLHVRSQSLPLLEPRTAVNGIVAAGHRGGRGITGFGGVPGGTGVVALGAEGGGASPGGTTTAGIGVLATGGRATGPRPTATDLTLHGPGVVASAFGSVQRMTLAETAHVGVFGQGGDQISDTRNVGGATFTVGPFAAGFGIVGRGGVSRTNGGQPNQPLVTTNDVSGTGVVGVAGGVEIPSPVNAVAAGVMGISDRGRGVEGTSRTGSGVLGTSETRVGVEGLSETGVGVVGRSRGERGGLFSSAKRAQLQLVPAEKNPRKLGDPPDLKGEIGDLLVTFVRDVEAVGNLTVAELWFCNIVQANGSTNWVKLA